MVEITLEWDDSNGRYIMSIIRVSLNSGFSIMV